MKRFDALDACRGFAILGMIFVNLLGSYATTPPFLKHATWNGLTFADIIFPLFLFVMGVAIPFSLRTENTSYQRIFRRAALLFLLGVLLNLTITFRFTPFRIMGVLQRIALCSLFASLLFLHTRPRTQATLALAILLGYTALLHLSLPCGISSPACNIAGTIDSFLLNTPFDPEGLTSTLPAFVTTLAGVWAGIALRNNTKHTRLLAAAAAILLLGVLLSFALPINKNLWTPSFVLVTAGISLSVLLFFTAIERRASILSLRALGRNPLIIYILATVTGNILALISIQGVILKDALTTALFASPLLFTITNIFLWTLLARYLYQKQIFIRL